MAKCYTTQQNKPPFASGQTAIVAGVTASILSATMILVAFDNTKKTELFRSPAFFTEPTIIPWDMAVVNTSRTIEDIQPMNNTVVPVNHTNDFVSVTGHEHEEILRNVALSAGITGTELVAFLAQMAHESGDFKHLVELRPNVKRYGSGRVAKLLGNKNMNDAKRFIGRGFIQLTGRWNYEWMQRKIGMDLTSTWSNAHKAADPHIAAEIAVIYWVERVRPIVEDFSDVHEVTKPINPRLNGIDDRINKYETFADALNVESI